ncbi:hypothetical protein YC2023_082397 [Brassica napus]
MAVQMVFLVSVKGVAEGLKGIDSCRVRLCVIMRVYSWVEVQRTRYYKAANFRGDAVYVFGITHSFLLGWICEDKEFTCSRQSSAEQVALSNRN